VLSSRLCFVFSLLVDRIENRKPKGPPAKGGETGKEKRGSVRSKERCEVEDSTSIEVLVPSTRS
jgi:hypothetical protein